MCPATAIMHIPVSQPVPVLQVDRHGIPLSVVVLAPRLKLGMARLAALLEAMALRVPSVLALKLGIALLLLVAAPMEARVPSVVSHLKLGMVRLAALLEAMALRVPSVLAVKLGLPLSILGRALTVAVPMEAMALRVPSVLAVLGMARLVSVLKA